MKPSELVIFQSLPDESIIALTVYGEARNQRMSGKLAVAFVMVNRHDLWHQEYKKLCLDGQQFECYKDGNANLPILLARAADLDSALQTDKPLRECMLAAQGAMSKGLASNVGKATFYKTLACKSPWFDKQIMAGKMVRQCVLGAHEFYTETRFLT